MSLTQINQNLKGQCAPKQHISSMMHDKYVVVEHGNKSQSICVFACKSNNSDCLINHYQLLKMSTADLSMTRAYKTRAPDL